jgi:hypothetical protein
MPLPFPNTAADMLVGCVFVLWLVITIAGVLRNKNITPGIVSTFAPTWPLFAPNPVNYNYDLAFRSERGEGQFSAWKPLPANYGRAWHHAVWNPFFDEQIFLFRMCQVLVELVETNPASAWLRQRAHDVLLSLVARRAGEEPDRIQFLITRHYPQAPDDAEVVFVSVAEP